MRHSLTVSMILRTAIDFGDLPGVSNYFGAGIRPNVSRCALDPRTCCQSPRTPPPISRETPHTLLATPTDQSSRTPVRALRPAAGESRDIAGHGEIAELTRPRSHTPAQTIPHILT